MSSTSRQVTNTEELNAAIADLELKAARQKEEMISSFAGVRESLKPMNLLKQTVQSTFSPGKKNDLVGTALGLGSGLLGRKLLFGSSSGILGKLLGAAVEFGLGGMVAKNAEKIKEKGSELIDRFLPKRKTATAPNLRSRTINQPPTARPAANKAGRLIPDRSGNGEDTNFFPKN